MTVDDIIYTLAAFGVLLCIGGVVTAIGLFLAVRREVRRDTYKGGPPPQAR